MGDFDDTLGSLVISTFLNTYILGIVGFQLISYRTIDFKDNWIIKAAVGLLFVVDMFQTAVAIYMVWVFCVSNYLNPPAFQTVQMWTYTVIPVCNAVSGAIVHLFLSHRIIKLAKRRSFYGLLVGSISMISAVFALVSSITSRFHMDKLQLHSTNRALVVVWLASQALADLMISGKYELSRTWSRSWLPHSIEQNVFTASLSAHIYSKKPEELGKSDSPHSMVSRVMGNIIQTGTLSTLFSGCTFLLFLASPKTWTYVAFLLPLGRIYTNCLLSVLLGRDTGRLKSGTNSPYVTNDVWAVHSGMSTQNQSFALVRVTTEREVVLDSEHIGVGYHQKSKSTLSSDHNEQKRRLSSESDVRMMHSMSVIKEDGARGISLNSVEDLKVTQTM